jgi:hypothetical protein
MFRGKEGNYVVLGGGVGCVVGERFLDVYYEVRYRVMYICGSAIYFIIRSDIWLCISAEVPLFHYELRYRVMCICGSAIIS